MAHDLFNQIKDTEYEMMDYYRINCINATGEYAPIKHILKPWNSAKSNCGEDFFLAILWFPRHIGLASRHI